MTRLSPQVDRAQAKHRGKLRGRRAEYADPKTMTRLSPQVDEHKPLNRGKLREPKTENFCTQKSNEMSSSIEYNISSKEESANIRWNGDRESKHSGGERSSTAKMLWQCPNFKPLMNCRFREERASKRTEKRPTGENYHSKQRLHCEWSLYSVPGGCKGITCFTRGAGKGGRCRCDGRATSKQTGSRGPRADWTRTNLARGKS